MRLFGARWGGISGMLALVACSAGAYGSADDIPEKPASLGAPGHFGLGLFAARSLYVGDGAAVTARELAQDIRAKTGGPVRVSSVIVLPTTMMLTVHRTGIDFDQWTWHDGDVRDPTVVRGTTERDVEASFELDKVPWSLLPAIRLAALENAALEGGKLASISVSLAHGAIEIRTDVRGLRRDASARFDVAGRLQ